MTRGKRQQVSLSEGSKKPMLQSIEDLQEEMRAQLESSSMNLNSELEELREKKKVIGTQFGCLRRNLGKGRKGKRQLDTLATTTS